MRENAVGIRRASRKLLASSFRLKAEASDPAGNPLPLLDRATILRRALVDGLDQVDALADALTERALHQGVHPGDLVDRPYPPRKLRAIARQLGIAPRKPGPTPRRVRAARTLHQA